MNADSQTVSAGGRLESLDALRGFDMFWIVGGSEVLRALVKGTSNPWLSALDAQFTHFPWEGFHFFDLIMPLFLFMIGVSMPFSFAKRLSLGQSRARLFGNHSGVSRATSGECSNASICAVSSKRSS